MAPQADHLFTYVTAIGEIRNFLRQSHRIQFDNLSAAIQQLSNAFLQPKTIRIRQTFGAGFDRRHERFNLLHAFAQFDFQRRAFLLTHLLEFVERLVQRAVQCIDYSLVDPVTGRLQRARNAGEEVDVEFTCDIEVLLQLLQRVDVAGDERTVQFVGELRGSFEADGDVNTSARETRADPFFDRWFEGGELRTGAQMDVEKPIVDGFQVDGDGEVLTRYRTLAISGHRFHCLVLCT